VSRSDADRVTSELISFSCLDLLLDLPPLFSSDLLSLLLLLLSRSTDLDLDLGRLDDFLSFDLDLELFFLGDLVLLLFFDLDLDLL